jgi:tetratricopeptide (TPR) repeat protein
MAPEQFMAEWRDFGPWTDLYSLGCVAYQLASGRVPFQEPDVLKLGTAHIRDRPPDLSCSSDYPAGFTGWVMQLLEKEPEYRYRRCADAATALKAIAESPTRSSVPVQLPTHNRVGALPDWQTFSRDRSPFRLVGAGLRLFGLRPVPLVNREPERDLLWDVFKEVASDGQARCVVLEGSAGTGKSRLAEWLFELTHELGLANCFKAEFDRSLVRETALSHMLASAMSCQKSNENDLSDRVKRILEPARLRSRTAIKAIMEFVAPAALGDAYRPGMFYEFQTQSRRFAALLEALTSVFSRRPLLIWLDDVHWGVEGIQFAQYVLDRSKVEAQQVMIVLTVRDDLVVDSNDGRSLLQTLCEHESTACSHIDTLTGSDGRTLVNRMLYLEGDLAESVRSRSGGNPLYATQLVGDWVSRGILEPGTSGFVLSGALEPSIPNDVHSVWVQRIERVIDETVNASLRFPSPSEQRIQTQIVLELAAVLGGRVDADEWRSVSASAGVSDPAPVLECLLASRLARADGESWSFSHSMLRDSIERIAREKQRWASHNKSCADMLEQMRPVPHWGDSERVGRYRFEAEQHEAAVGPLLKGARERIRVEEYSAAVELLDLRERAIDELAYPADHPTRLENLLIRAEIKCTRGELGEAEQLAAELRILAQDNRAERFVGAAIFLKARVKHQDGALNLAIDQYAQAEAILRVSGPKHELAACLSEKASALLDVGRLAFAAEAFNEAQEIFEDTGRLLPWAQNQLGLARVALRQGDRDHAKILCRRVNAFARREQLGLVEANASMILAEIQIAEGAHEEATESLDRSISLFQQMGLDRQELHPRLLRVLMLLESASVERAKTELAQLWSGPDIDAPRTTTLLMSCLGLVLDVGEDPADFEAAVAEVAELIGEVEVLPPEVVRCLQLAIERALEVGQPERASWIRKLGPVAAMDMGTEG